MFPRVNERLIPGCLSQSKAYGGGGVMACGGITAAGKTPLVTVPGNLTARRYIDEVLQPYVIPAFQNQRFTFMHDNAPAHRAAITTQFMQANIIPLLNPWSKYSKAQPMACVLTGSDQRTKIPYSLLSCDFCKLTLVHMNPE